MTKLNICHLFNENKPETRDVLLNIGTSTIYTQKLKQSVFRD